MLKNKIAIVFIIFTIGYSFAQIDIGIIDNNVDGNTGSNISVLDTNSCSSFYLLPTEKYIISGWVKETHEEQPHTYQNSGIEISFLDADYEVLSSEIIMPSGNIIDGWQRIIGTFTIPNRDRGEQGEPQSIFVGISLINLSDSNNCFFDDIRVFPFNGTLKSFVYDGKTQRLMAELDENNYATFYEYDKEGGLVRVKKETEEGIYTIQETRSSTVKQ